MHCLDPDFSIFSILPPFNTINVQLVRGGLLVTNPAGIDVTYQARADLTGSINKSSIGKTNFWTYAQALFGVALPPDTGLSGFSMPGPNNTPQDAEYVAAWNWFHAEGVPFTPIDDAMQPNPYSLLKWEARDSGGNLIASTIASVPNSKEMECSRCHASGTNPATRPSMGWVHDPNPLKDDRYNILRLHDDLQAGSAVYQNALVTVGYDPAGLEATVRNQATPVLCARCHPSNALPGSGLASVTPMTQAMHSGHAQVLDSMGDSLNQAVGRASCYACHPGDVTQCLRGAMGKAIGADGHLAMDCQGCHGTMADVGSPTRQGWFEEPNCQACHAGSATQNPGQIRYTSVFDALGNMRVPTTDLFATDPNTPAAGFSLFRFSTGHGNLQCSACHGPPHAIYPTSEVNDNLQSIVLQGHEGTLQECSACHTSLSSAQRVQGPHGMHPSNSSWVNGQHGDWVESHGSTSCRECHGSDARGSVLSEAKTDRSYNTTYGTKQLYRGYQVGCYNCHDGPGTDDSNNNSAPSVQSFAVQTPNDEPLPIQMLGSDPNNTPLVYKIIQQPQHGTVGWSGSTATYFPKAGYVGGDSFQYAAWDGEAQSPRGTIQVQVDPAACQGTIEYYGFGCPSSTGEVPRLLVEGCPTVGGSLDLTIDRVPANVWVMLVQGVERDTRELWLGCALRVRSPLNITLLQADSNGRILHSLGMPSMAGQTIDVQAFVIDTALGTRGTFSNAVEIHVP